MKKYVIFFTVLALGISCSASKKKIEEAKMEKQVQEVKVENTPQAVNEPNSDLKLVLEKAKTEESEIFAPKTSAGASQMYETYNKTEKKDPNPVIESYMQVIKKVSAIKADMADVVKARLEAISAGATLENAEFKKTEGDLVILTKTMEAGEKVDQKKKDQLLLSYKKIEMMMIKDKYLLDSKKIIDECIVLKGDELAPKTMKEVKHFYDEVNTMIEKDRYNHEVITPKAKEVKFLSQRALNIVLEVKKLSAETKEESVLRNEKLLESIAKALEIADMRNLNFLEQQEEINQYIVSLFKAGRNINVEKNQMNDQLSTLKETVGELSKKDKIRNTVSDMQKEFNLSEVEIYQQEERIIMRLTNLKFAPNKVEINSTQEEYLNKIGEMLKKLGKIVVIVEGHTDSLGNEKMNQELSQKRADKVREYFISKEYLKEDLSSSSGFGDTRPITGNKTAAERAQNRRVDLVITVVD